MPRMRARNLWVKVLFYGGLVTVAIVLLVVFSGVAVGGFDQRVGKPIPQPVPFSHALHAGEMGISCRYCHAAVERASYAGLPPTETCMTCHSQVRAQSPLLAPVRESWERGTPLEWSRVVEVPDFVYFNHSIHVAKGVGCATCHGPVQQMPVLYQARPFEMRFCLDCHRAPEKYLRPREEVFNMNYRPPAEQLELGRKLVEAHGVNQANLTDCSVCHR